MMVFHRNLPEQSLALFMGQAVLGEITGCHHGENRRGRLGGKSVAPGSNRPGLRKAGVSRILQFLRPDRHDVPASLDGVFQKMLAKRPEDRHQSMADVTADLEACLAGKEPPSLTATLATPGASETPPLTPTSPSAAAAKPLIVQTPLPTASRLRSPAGRKNTQLLFIGLVGAILVLGALLGIVLLLGGSP